MKSSLIKLLLFPVALMSALSPGFVRATRGQTTAQAPLVRAVTIDGGVELHYVEAGKGVAVVFVHGSLSDGSFWNPQIAPFAEKYRAIAYSRRYDQPNTNQAQAGYSAVTDADDLAGLIKKLNLGRVHVVGHSYGAYTALFLAVRHPELVRSIIVAEAPAIPLLAYLPEPQAELGKTTLADIRKRMEEPMRAAFKKGDENGGVAAFIDYLSGDPNAWDNWTEQARKETLRNAHEWDVMLTEGELFPDLRPEDVRKIKTPTLLLSGSNTFEFLKLIDEELARLLPNGQRVVLPGATHHMWYEQPEKCRSAVVEFLQRK